MTIQRPIMNTGLKTAIAIGVIVIAAALVATSSMFFKTRTAPGGTQSVATTTPAAGPITVRGTALCLPHKDTSGPQTLECAFGIKDTEGRYFGLSDTDTSYRNLMDLPFNKTTVEVSGTFTPRTDSNYQDIGVIAVSSARLVDPLPAKTGETVSAFGVSITPTATIEDSRCPTDVTCIQAGTVRVRATVTAGGASAPTVQVFQLGKPISLGSGQEAVLVSVDPAPRSTEPQSARNYTFYFDIRNATSSASSSGGSTASAPVAAPGGRCGGNMMNAPVCGTGYRCAPVPGSHLPFGDVGGACVVAD